MKFFKNFISSMILRFTDSKDHTQVRYLFHLVRRGPITTAHCEAVLLKDRVQMAMVGNMSSKFLHMQIESQALYQLLLGMQTILLVAVPGNTELNKNERMQVQKGGVMTSVSMYFLIYNKTLIN